jgi:hypothetical protein
MPKIMAVIVEPGKEPVLFHDGDPWVQMKWLTKKATLQFSGYPPQYGRRPSVCLLVDEDGLFSRHPYNRWGIIGTIAVVVRHGSGLREIKPELAAQIVADLKDIEGGYLFPECTVANHFKEMKEAGHAIPPPGHQPPEGLTWVK